jgi:hypothetical protein
LALTIGCQGVNSANDLKQRQNDANKTRRMNYLTTRVFQQNRMYEVDPKVLTANVYVKGLAGHALPTVADVPGGAPAVEHRGLVIGPGRRHARVLVFPKPAGHDNPICVGVYQHAQMDCGESATALQRVLNQDVDNLEKSRVRSAIDFA